MSDLLHRILNRMCEIIHRVNAPSVSRIVVRHMRHTVDHRITHVDVRRCHIDLGAQYLLSVLVFPVLHLFKEPKILLHRTVAVRTVLPWFLKRAPVFTDLVGSQVTDERLPLLDQFDRTLIHHFKIIRCKIQVFLPVGAKPLHILLDRLYKFHILLGRIGVVEPQMEGSVIFLRQPGIQKDRLGVSDMKISVRLRLHPDHSKRI